MRRSILHRAAGVLMRAAAHALPPHAAHWGRAMEAEFSRLESGPAAIAWAAGCGKVALMARITPMLLVYALLLALAAAALLYFEWHTDEVTVVLALLLAVAAVLGFLRPGAALATGLVVGLAIPLAHLASTMTGRFIPVYQSTPPSGTDALVMAALVIPGLAAAFLGAWVRRQVMPQPGS
jgi:hypothetical protein